MGVCSMNVSAVEKFAYRLLMVQNLVPAVSGSRWNQLTRASLNTLFAQQGGLDHIVSGFLAMPRHRPVNDPERNTVEPDLPGLPTVVRGKTSVDR